MYFAKFLNAFVKPQNLNFEFEQGDKALMGGGTHEGGHKLKVLLMLSCNYTMQFIGYDSIKTRRFIFYRFQWRTITQHQTNRIVAINRIM